MIPAIVRSKRAAALPVAYALAVLVTLPVLPGLWYAVLPSLGLHVTALFALAGVVVAAGLGVRAWTVAPVRRWRAVGALLLVVSAYGALLVTFYAHAAPGEKAHLLEYGVLAYLALGAVRTDRRGGIAAALVFVALVGVTDELVQAILPQRYFGLDDIAGNLLGGALGALAWAAASARSPWRGGGA